MTRARGVFAAGAALVFTALVLPAPASAVDAVQSGWWSRGNGGGVPPPPGAPDGGLQVAADPVGPSAVAAVRFTLAAGDANPVLALPVATADNPTSATLSACRAKKPWTAVEAGPWSARPDYDCSAGVVVASLSPDGKTATLDVSQLVDDAGTVDVVLFTQPGAPPSGVPATPVSAGVVNFTFAPVTPAAVRVDAGDAPAGDSTGAGTASDVPVDEGALSPTFDVGATPSFDVPSPSPAPELGLPPVGGAPATGAPTTVPAAAGGPTAVAAPAFAPAATVGDDRRTRLLFAFVFADLALWWYWVTFRRPPAADVRRTAPPLR